MKERLDHYLNSTIVSMLSPSALAIFLPFAKPDIIQSSHMPPRVPLLVPILEQYFVAVRVRRYRLHYTKHYIISLSDNRAQRDDRVRFHSGRCREKYASVSTCCNIYRSHASVKNLGSLHDSVTNPVGSVQDTVSSCRLHPRCVPWTGHVPWILYEDSNDYCSI